MALPFELPTVSRGFAALRPGVADVGARTAEAAARSLSRLFADEVRVSGRPVPGGSAPRSPAARVALELTALPGSAILDVDPALAARLVDLLAGGGGDIAAAAALTPIEEAALELLVLAALDGVAADADLEGCLAPRLVRGAPEPSSPLAVELAISVGDVSGRARLLLPAAAVRGLARIAPVGAGSPIAAPVALRGGAARLAPEELDALSPGDAVVLDEAPGDRLALALPGGFRAEGLVEQDRFHVKETHMTERIDEIPIALEVELCRFPLPLGELARLEPGAVLVLPVDRSGQVVLRAGERAVARGELVDVDGAVGVRIAAVEVAP